MLPWLKKNKIKLTILILSIFYLVSLDKAVGTIGDTSKYIVLAESVATGKGYKNIHLVNSPPNDRYPPLYPLLLAPFFAFGRNFVAMKLVSFASALVALWLLYQLLLRHTDETTAFLLVLLIGASSLFVKYTDRILTEMPYLALTIGAMLVIERYAGLERWWAKEGLLAGLLLLATVMLRSVGISLLVGGFLYLLFADKGKKWRARAKKGLLLIAPSVIFMGLWALRALSVGSYYARVFLLVDPNDAALGKVNLGQLLLRLPLNFHFYLTSLAGVEVRDLRLEPFLILAPAAVFFLLLIGYRRFSSHPSAISYYVAFYLAIFAFWPWRATRFLLPILPFLFLYLFVGLEGTIKRLAVLGEKRYVRAVFVLILVIGLIPVLAFKSEDTQVLGRYSLNFFCVLLVYLLVLLAAFIFVFSKKVWAAISLVFRSPRLIHILLFLALVVVSMNTIFKELKRKEAYEGPWRGYAAMAEWIRDNSPEGSVVAARAPEFFYVLSRRKIYPQYGSEDSILSGAVDYVVVDRLARSLGWRVSSAQIMLPLAEKFPDRLNIVYEDSGNIIYGIVK
ncbi:MAG: hypothetical protein AMS15_05020 [Planctomycetes bacterium DG_23]|nr:MAG: hypothetical protein AMS15_05020 [Planctomycetes bacterium DG_23]